jgi:hypothetical protein
MAEQLVKKEGQGYNRVYPKTFIDSITDRETGQNLTEILSNFNCYFLPYTGDDESTRLQVPALLRKAGLWITYIPAGKSIVVEYYSSNDISDDAWKSSKNWSKGSNTLVGEISISSDGYWIINGNKTDIRATGDTGITPIIKIEDNKFQASYNEGESFVDLSNLPVYTKFRVTDNKLQASFDLGINWQDFSDYIAAWFRWVKGEDDTLGKIQISRDNSTWDDLTPYISNNLKIQGYYKTIDAAPKEPALGYMILVGPNSESNYELYIYISTGWLNLGSFQIVQAGIIDSIDKDSTDETKVPTAKAVIDFISPIEERVETLESQLNNLTIEAPLSESDFESLESNGELKKNSLYFVFENDEEGGT